MGMKCEIEIPPQLTEPLLRLASETELPLEDIVETALRNYLERSQDNFPARVIPKKRISRSFSGSP